MDSSKTCFKCGEYKPIEQFYRHPQMADGHLNKCIECTKKDVSEHRGENLEKVRQYDKERSKLPARKALAASVTKAWRQEDRRRTAAHNAVAKAIKSGALIQQSCSRCGSVKSLAHHEDYDKKLDVVWLCQPCHKQRHKEIAAALKQQASAP